MLQEDFPRRALSMGDGSPGTKRPAPSAPPSSDASAPLDGASAKRSKLEAAPRPKEEELLAYESLAEVVARLQRSPAGRHWDLVGIRHHFGICVPLFALRSAHSAGVGEFLDLLPLVDWMKARTKFDVIQLLPLNAINAPADFSPFSPRSCFSLNPLLLSLRALPNFDAIPADIMKQLDALNKAHSVDWLEVNRLKTLAFQAYVSAPEQQATIRGEEFKQFVEANKDWILGYAVFSCLKKMYEGKPWEAWPVKLVKEKQKDDEATLVELSGRCDAKEIDYHIFLQYLCHKQMSQAKQYANDKGIFLKGDIPFLVSKDSSDVWVNQNLFDSALSTGAPPDAFSADGQNWDLPLYRWETARLELEAWWKRRLVVAQQYYNIYRIDHIAGFFRVWAIPKGKKATEGSYVPSDERLWAEQGERNLRVMLESSDMLPIGEDLGTVPKKVRLIMQKLGICGTKVIRWERNWDSDQKTYFPISSFNADSMTTVSTHDSETLSQWWRDKHDEVKAFCSYKGWDEEEEFEKGWTLSNEKRKAILQDSHRSPSLFHINLLQEYLALVPDMIHKNAELERINVPSSVSSANWTYRLAIPTEEMSRREDFHKLLQGLFR